MQLEAFLFVPALVASIISGLIFLCKTAHHYLTILENTAAGCELITWLPETFAEYFWKAGYVMWLLVLCYAPSYVLARLCAPDTISQRLVLVILVGLIYPVSQLSSLAASSSWYPLHYDTIQRLWRRPQILLNFYLLSLPLLGLAALALYLAIWAEIFWALRLCCAVLLVVCLFTYGRLLGQLAYALQLVGLPQKRRRTRKKASRIDIATAARVVQQLAPPPPSVHDLPPIHTPRDGPVYGYQIQQESISASRAHRIVAEAVDDDTPEIAPANSANSLQTSSQESEHYQPQSDSPSAHNEDDNSYRLQGADTESDQRPLLEWLGPSEQERQLRQRQRPSPISRTLWSREIITFLAQPAALMAWLSTSAWACLIVLLIQLARAYYPTGQ
jgi:hypothetical protein